MTNHSTKNTLLGVVAAVAAVGVIVLIAVSVFNSVQNAKAEKDPLFLLEKYYKNINPTTSPLVKGNVDLDEIDLYDSLPDIDKYQPVVAKNTDLYIEIFSSTEKATVTNKAADNDRWLVDMGQEFNNAKITVDGRPVSVQIRGIASGLIADYTISGKAIPTAISPSNTLWGDMLIESGVRLEMYEECLVQNTAGIVLSKNKYDELKNNYSEVNIDTVTKAIIAGELNFGYTNPFASSTGANFLMSSLTAFDSSNPLSSTAAEMFNQLQTNIPYVAYTTLQMKESAKSGALDGFVFEYQQFQNSADLKADYIFTPFGVRHDNPMYAVGNLTSDEAEILRLFCDFCKTSAAQQKATSYGFLENSDYISEPINGKTLISAQKFWKENKNNSREIVAVFVADLSGSMTFPDEKGNVPINQLKKSLMSGSKNIKDDVSIGIVTFSDDVQIALPIAPFDFNQKSYFAGAVSNMQAEGSTAMYDAIVVASKQLLDIKEQKPNAKIMMFVLTDGETNKGLTFDKTKNMISEIGIPIYTIGYNANISGLEELAALNEAAFMNADSEDIIYKLTGLFNAEM